MEPLLQVEKINLSFKNEDETSKVLKDVSFDIFPGEFVAVVGESGSGKSMTALSVIGLLPPGSHLSGNISFDGKQISGSPDKEPVKKLRGKNIGMIFQEPMTSLNPLMTCGKQVSESLEKHFSLSQKEARKKVLDLFEKVELPEPSSMLDRYPHQLSGGQKQRVMIAMAISCDPALLIADEPTTALDVNVQASILDLLKKISIKNQLSVMLITHDLGIVADVADRIIVMRKGMIVESGSTKDIFIQPQHPYTRALLACRVSGNDKRNYLPVLNDAITGKYIKEARPVTTLNEDVILSVKDLSVHYTVTKGFLKQPVHYAAVDSISFDVMSNEIVGLVGESGCGKTTAGKAIMNLITPSSGEILLNGIRISSEKGKQLRELRKYIQVVFQDPYNSLNPSMKIGEAISEVLMVHEPALNRSQRRQRVIEMLEKLELSPEHYNRYPHEFSGGQRQRICIARALILKPSFVIFDESVSALDVSVQAQVLNLILKLRAEMNFSAVFISHDLSVVRYLCDRILVMRKGRIIEAGNPDRIFASPEQEYTRMLINAIPGKTGYDL